MYLKKSTKKLIPKSLIVKKIAVEIKPLVKFEFLFQV